MFPKTFQNVFLFCCAKKIGKKVDSTWNAWLHGSFLVKIQWNPSILGFPSLRKLLLAARIRTLFVYIFSVYLCRGALEDKRETTVTCAQWTHCILTNKWHQITKKHINLSSLRNQSGFWWHENYYITLKTLPFSPLQCFSYQPRID